MKKPINSVRRRRGFVSFVDGRALAAMAVALPFGACAHALNIGSDETKAASDSDDAFVFDYGPGADPGTLNGTITHAGPITFTGANGGTLKLRMVNTGYTDSILFTGGVLNINANSALFGSMKNFNFMGSDTNRATLQIDAGSAITLDGQNSEKHIFRVENDSYGGFSLLNGSSLTFTGGHNTTNEGSGFYGGAVNGRTGSNLLFSGAGSDDTTLKFSGNQVTSSDASGYGGAVSNRGSVEFSDLTSVAFSGNKVTGACGNKGGAVYNAGGAAFKDIGTLTFDGNYVNGYSSLGGAVYNDYNANLSFADIGTLVFKDSTSTSHGGSIHNDSKNKVTFDNIDTLEFKNSQSVDGNGGAIYNSSISEIAFTDVKNISFLNENPGITNAKSGGGIRNHGTMSFIVPEGGSLLFKDLKAGSDDGGGIYNVGKLTLANDNGGSLRFEGLKTDGGGGAILTTGSSSVLTISGALFVKNHSDIEGSVIYALNATVNLTDTDVLMNSSTNGIGAVVVMGTNLTLNVDKADTVTFSGNEGRGGKTYGIVFYESLQDKDNAFTMNIAEGKTLDMRDTMAGGGSAITTIEKNGSGLWKLAGDNEFIGETSLTVNAGTLYLYREGEVDNPISDTDTATKVAQGAIDLSGHADSVFTLKQGATLQVSGLGASSQQSGVSVGGTLTLEGGSILAFDLATAKTDKAQLALQGATEAIGTAGDGTGKIVVNITNTASANASGMILATTTNGTFTGKYQDTVLWNGKDQTQTRMTDAFVLSDTDGGKTLLITQRAVRNVITTWTNEKNNHKWSVDADANWSALPSKRFYHGDLVNFDGAETNASPAIAIDSAGVKVAALYLGGNKNYTFTGGSITASSSSADTTLSGTAVNGKLILGKKATGVNTVVDNTFDGTADFTGLAGTNVFQEGAEFHSGKLIISTAGQLGLTSLDKLSFLSTAPFGVDYSAVATLSIADDIAFTSGNLSIGTGKAGRIDVAADKTLSFSNAGYTGAGMLIKEGTGTVSFDGYSATGDLKVTAGVVELNGGATGAGSRIDLSANTTLRFNSSGNADIKAAIGGAGVVESAGAASTTTTLSTASAHTGTTTVKSGTLSLAAANALAASSGVTVSNTATLAAANADQSFKNLAIDTGGAYAGGGKNVAVDAAAIRGAFTGVNNLTKNSTGTLAVNQASVPTISLGGDLNIAAGALTVASGNAFAVTGTAAFGDNTTLGIGLNKTIGAANVSIGSGTVIDVASGYTGGAAITLVESANAIVGDFTTVKIGGTPQTVAVSLDNYLNRVLVQKSADLKRIEIRDQGLVWNNTLPGSAHGVFDIGVAENITESLADNTVAAAWYDDSPNSTYKWDGKTLTKCGLGVLTLSAANTHTGGNVIEGGTLKLADRRAAGAGGIDLAEGAVLELAFNYTADPFTNAISGAGAVKKTGSGAVVLSTVSTHTGATTVEAGNVILDVADAFADSARFEVKENASASSLNAQKFKNLTVEENASFVMSGATPLTRDMELEAGRIDGALRNVRNLTKTTAAKLAFAVDVDIAGDLAVGAGELAVGQGRKLTVGGVAGFAAGTTFVTGFNTGLAADGDVTIGTGATLDITATFDPSQQTTVDLITSANGAIAGAFETLKINGAVYDPTAGILARYWNGLTVRNSTDNKKLQASIGGLVWFNTAAKSAHGVFDIATGEVEIAASLTRNTNTAAWYDDSPNSTYKWDGRTLTKRGGGDLVLTGDSAGLDGAANVEGGGLYVNNKFGGDVNVLADASLGGSGTVIGQVSVSADGSVGPGHRDAGTLTVQGGVTFASGSFLDVGVDLDDDTGLANTRLEVTGAVSIAAGCKVSVTNINASALYRESGTWTILRAGAITGAFDDEVEHGYAFLELGLIQRGNEVILTLGFNEDDFRDKLLGYAGTRNQRAAAIGILGQKRGGEFYDAVATQSVDADFPDLLDQASGEIHAHVPAVLHDYERGFGRDLRQRFLYRSEKGDGFPIWVRTEGGHSRRDGDGNAAKYRYRGFGLSLGVERAVSPSLLFGGAFRYGRNELKADRRRSKADVDSFDFGLYAGVSRPAGAGDLNLTLGGGYGLHRVDSTRRFAHLGENQRLTADYNAHTALGFAEAGWLTRLNGAVSLEPFAGLTWTSVWREKYRERGGYAAVASRNKHQGSLAATLGLRARFAVSDRVDLKASANWQRLFGNRQSRASHGFAGGEAFTVYGVPMNRDMLEAGVGMEIRLTRNAGLAASYNGLYGKDKFIHNGQVTLFRVF